MRKHRLLQTSRVLHERIRWDPSFDERAFTVVYEERFTGRRERPFTEFPTTGEIPWHRVWEYRVGELVVWSRAERIDLLFGSGDSGQPEHERVHEAIARVRPRVAPLADVSATEAPLEPLTVQRYDAVHDAWRAAPASSPAPLLRPRALVVATLNVLFDRHDDGSLHTARRIPAMLEQLRRCGADLIALQEVTPRIAGAIWAEPWVRRDYFGSDGPQAVTLEPYGVLLLSRVPMRAGLRRGVEGERKRAVVATLELAEGPLHVVAVHLTSDRAHDAAARRARELAQALRDLSGLGPGPALLLGDLNADEGPLDEALRAAGFVDLWSTLRPGEDGATFDPHTNALARLGSRSGRARRLDRIMLRPADDTWPRAIDIGRVAVEPTARDSEGQPLPISDHYGLRARLRVDRARGEPGEPPRFRPTHHAAVVVIPPREAWPAIQAIRREHDRAAARWMPHVSLLYGFAPGPELAAAARIVGEVVGQMPRFRVTLERLRSFARKGGATVWLEPRCEPPDALVRLQAALFERFPWCDEQSRKSPRGFVPHLTVAQLREPDAEATLARWQAAWRPVSFTVDALAVIHRGQEGPFSVQHVVELGPGARSETAIPLPAEAAALRDRVARAVREGLHPAPPRDAPVVLVAGSHRLGVAEPAADLDLVAITARSLGWAELVAELPGRLRAQGGEVRARVVEHATAPRLALRLDGREVDLQHVAWPSERPWRRAVEALAACDELDARSRGAVITLAHAEALLEHAARHGGIERYRGALRELRRWAARRDVDDNALGYPGGLAWAVMLAEAATIVPCDPTDEDAACTLLGAGLRLLARRSAEDWRRDPVAIDPRAEPAGLEADPSPMLVLEPAGPASNCMRRATATTLRVLMAELERAVAWLDDARPSSEPSGIDLPAIDPCEEHPWLLAIELRAADEDGLDALVGFVRGRAVGLVRALERKLLGTGAALRPYSRPLVVGRDEQGAARVLVLGLDAAAPSLPPEPLRELEQAVLRWEGCPAGAAVRLAVWSAAVARAHRGG